jgi:hypothetical protein
VSALEVLGYLGLTGGLFGTFLMLSLEMPDQTTVGWVSLGVAAVLLLAGVVVGAGAPDRLARFRSVCWYLSVSFLTSALQAWLVTPSSLLRGGSDLFVVFLMTALYAFALWALLPRLLQQLAFFSAVLSALASLTLPSAAAFFFAPPDLTGLALVFWLGGAVWFALGWFGRVRPPRVAMVLGELASLPGPLLFATESAELAFVLLIATSAVYLLVGGRQGDRAVTGIAAVGEIVGVVGLLVALGVDDEASGAAVLVLGAAFLVVAVLLARQLGAPRPSLGRPVLPIGPKVVPASVGPVAGPAIPPPPSETPPPSGMPPPSETPPPSGMPPPSETPPPSDDETSPPV